MKSVRGVLEIDSDRGVIYFTSTEKQNIGQTVLRVSNVPKHFIDMEMIDLRIGVKYEYEEKEVKNGG